MEQKRQKSEREKKNDFPKEKLSPNNTK